MKGWTGLCYWTYYALVEETNAELITDQDQCWKAIHIYEFTSYCFPSAPIGAQIQSQVATKFYTGKENKRLKSQIKEAAGAESLEGRFWLISEGQKWVKRLQRAVEAEKTRGPSIWGEEALSMTQELKSIRLEPGEWGREGVEGEDGESRRGSRMAWLCRLWWEVWVLFNATWSLWTLIVSRGVTFDILNTALSLCLSVWGMDSSRVTNQLEGHGSVKGMVMVASVIVGSADRKK